MKIVFDLDNTLVDELGSTVRPGIIELMNRLQNEDHDLILWTNSRKNRARQILLDHNLKQYFSSFIFREDYDPQEKGLFKDIRKIHGDFLIDDDPEEIKYIKSIKKKGFLVKSYRKNQKPDPGELDELYRCIKKPKGFFRR